MNAQELRDKYHAELRDRLAALEAERVEIQGILGEAPPKGGKWSEDRRRAQSRRMKRLHRAGVFKKR